MGMFGRWLLIGAVTLIQAPQAQAQVAQREPTDIYIRRLAGLPAESANGQIEVIDVGHGPLDTVLSIVANRTDKGWSVSYDCASSPHCGLNQDHRAVSYVLSGQSASEVDGILKELESGKEPDGQLPSPTFIGGNLLVTINDHGFKHDYRRSGLWGKRWASWKPCLVRLRRNPRSTILFENDGGQRVGVGVGHSVSCQPERMAGVGKPKTDREWQSMGLLSRGRPMLLPNCRREERDQHGGCQGVQDCVKCVRDYPVALWQECARPPEHAAIPRRPLRVGPEQVGPPPRTKLAREQHGVADPEPTPDPSRVAAVGVGDGRDETDREGQALDNGHPDQAASRVERLNRGDVVQASKWHPIVRPQDGDLDRL